MKLFMIIFSLISMILARPEMRYSTSGNVAESEGGPRSGAQPTTPPPPRFDPNAQKSVYVFISSQEPEYLQASAPVLPPRPPQTHYKIVFIKTPTQATPPPPVIPPFSQDSEKTLIYVLVKRPEGPNSIVIPTPSPTKPSKPEVYFIRYKAQTETSVRDVVTPRPLYRGTPSPVYGVHR